LFTAPARILITGASGCVGQYTAAWLLENSDAELLLWLRDPGKLSAISANQPRVRLLVGDLRETDRFASELSTVNRVIHTATAWGDPERAHQVNVVAVKRMLALLNPASLSRSSISQPPAFSIVPCSRFKKPWPTAPNTFKPKLNA
jgi:nucleoside-diphosphate-sugar epimerase